MGWVLLVVAFSFVFCLGWALGAAAAQTGALADDPASSERRGPSAPPTGVPIDFGRQAAPR